MWLQRTACIINVFLKFLLHSSGLLRATPFKKISKNFIIHIRLWGKWCNFSKLHFFEDFRALWYYIVFACQICFCPSGCTLSVEEWTKKFHFFGSWFFCTSFSHQPALLMQDSFKKALFNMAISQCPQKIELTSRHESYQAGHSMAGTYIGIYYFPRKTLYR